MHCLSACRHPAQLRLFARTLAIIKLLTLRCLSIFDHTASLQRFHWTADTGVTVDSVALSLLVLSPMAPPSLPKAHTHT